MTASPNGSESKGRLSEDEWDAVRDLWSDSFQIVIDTLEEAKAKTKLPAQRRRILSAINVSEEHRRIILGVLGVLRQMNGTLYHDTNQSERST